MLVRCVMIASLAWIPQRKCHILSTPSFHKHMKEPAHPPTVMLRNYHLILVLALRGLEAVIMSEENDYGNEKITWDQNKDTWAEKSDHCPGDPSPQVGSKGGSHIVTTVTLACLWILLLCLATAWVVLYTSNKMKGNLSGNIERLSSELQQNKRNNSELKHLLKMAQEKRCTSGWEFYIGSCYYFSKDKLTWEQSQYACIHDGGHLVIIESEQEQNFLRNKVGNIHYTNFFWIGMTDSKVEGTWVWIDNTTLNNNIKYWDLHNGTNYWKYPEPNDREKAEDCAQMGGRCSDQISCWNDNGCYKPFKRICESRSIL